LRLQTQDPIEVTQSHPFYVASMMDNRSPINWVSKIEVPTLLAGAWQDEQTGGDFASMLKRVPNRRDVKIAVTNGVHTSSLEPENLFNWIAFLDLYVARQVPDPSRVIFITQIIYEGIFAPGAMVPPVPPDRWDGITDYQQALDLFESDPHVLVRMENGAGSAVPGLTAPTFELGFRQWPPREARPTKWYFGPDGTLSPRKSRGADDIDVYRPDPDSRPQQTLPGSSQNDS